MNIAEILDPYTDRILLRQIILEYKSKGGLILGENEKDSEVMFAEVIAVGAGKQVDTLGVIPMKTKVGDIVVVNARIPLRVNYKGINYYVVNESNILLGIKDKQIEIKEFKSEGYEYDASGAKILN